MHCVPRGALGGIDAQVLQGAAIVTVEGIRSRSTSLVKPALTYVATDYYSSVVHTMRAQEVRIVSDEDVARGQRSARYTAYRGANFTELSVTGIPGQRYMLEFVPDETGWATLAIAVDLESCSPGEVYNTAAKRCDRCDAGTIKFDNSSEACVSCEGTGLTCLGGADFALMDGYWMASRYVEAACVVSDVACVMEQVYPCPAILNACSAPSAGVERRNMDGAPYVAEPLLCAANHGAASTVLCAGCQAGTAFSHISATCEECEDAWVLWVRLIALLLVLVGLSAALVSGLLKHWQGRGATRMARDIHVGLQLSSLCSVALGHLQVVGQTLLLYSAEVLPPVYRDFLIGPTLLTRVSLPDWFSTVCLMHSLGLRYDAADMYYLNIIIHSALPLLLFVPVVAGGMHLVWRNRKGRNWQRLRAALARDASSASQAAGAPPLEGGSRCGEAAGGEAAAMVFPRKAGRGGSGRSSAMRGRRRTSVMRWGGEDRPPATPEEQREQDLVDVQMCIGVNALMLLHPVCATYMFQLFRCTRIYLDHAQHWVAAEPEVECFTSTWNIMARTATLVIVLYILIVPLLLIAVPHYLKTLCKVRRLDNDRVIYVARRELQRMQENDDTDFEEMRVSGLLVSAMSSSCRLDGFRVDATDSALSGRTGGPRYVAVLPDTGERIEVEAQLYNNGVQLETALDHPLAAQLLGPCLNPFCPELYWWAGYDMYRKLVVSSSVVLVQRLNSKYELFYAAITSTCAVVLHSYMHPYALEVVNLVQTMLLASQCLTYTMLLAEKYANNDSGSLWIGIFLVATQVGVCAVMGFFIMKLFLGSLHSFALDSVVGSLRRGKRRMAQIGEEAPSQSVKNDEVKVEKGTTFNVCSSFI
ncbi:hypothetical protein CYMTET_10696 [Cymbomonas tetramitiformis]|uniref:Uncharacterized protein n=1 Tax=Cymbomonas tetramitiformis TaxID=36881 RepID=A0AAE0GP38_9CHLO|nr:hypothetical protein CYMTET_10696 [Cymbomonas tetramitiformis]